MTETVTSAATRGKTLEYSESFWTGGRSLAYDGTPLERKSNKLFVLKTADGETEFKVSGNRFKGVFVSSSLLDGEVCVMQKFTPLDYVIAVLTLAPCVAFGAVGGAIGGVFAAVNMYFTPKIKPTWLKATIGVELAVVAGFTAFWIAYAVGSLFWQ